MILSVSRYTSQLEEQKQHDAQISMQVEAAVADVASVQVQEEAEEPTSKLLNSDSEFN